MCERAIAFVLLDRVVLIVTVKICTLMNAVTEFVLVTFNGIFY